MQQVHVKCGANDVYSFCRRKFFYNDTKGTLKRLLMQKICNGIQARQAPIDALDSTPRLHTHTRGFKGRGCCRAFPAGPFLMIFLCGRAALCRHTTSNWWGLKKPRLGSHMQGEIYMKFEINQRKELN